MSTKDGVRKEEKWRNGEKEKGSMKKRSKGKEVEIDKGKGKRNERRI